MNAKLRKKTKNNFEKDFFRLMNNAVFGKNINTWRFWIWKNKCIAQCKSDIDKMYLSAKDPYEAKYQLLINKRKSRLKVFKCFKSFY